MDLADLGDWTSHVYPFFSETAQETPNYCISCFFKDMVCLVVKMFPRKPILFSPRKILLLDGDLLVKRRLRPLFRLEPVSAGKAGKDKVGVHDISCS